MEAGGIIFINARCIKDNSWKVRCKQQLFLEFLFEPEGSTAKRILFYGKRGDRLYKVASVYDRRYSEVPALLHFTPKI